MKVYGRWELFILQQEQRENHAFLPEQLLRIGREPPVRLTHTRSMSKQEMLEKQPLLELVTFVFKPALS